MSCLKFPFPSNLWVAPPEEPLFRFFLSFFFFFLSFFSFFLFFFAFFFFELIQSFFSLSFLFPFLIFFSTRQHFFQTVEKDGQITRQRDWNEDFQYLRELPHRTLDEKMFRDHSLYRLQVSFLIFFFSCPPFSFIFLLLFFSFTFLFPFVPLFFFFLYSRFPLLSLSLLSPSHTLSLSQADFIEEVKQGAEQIMEGRVQPINPMDPFRNQMFIRNKIFYCVVGDNEIFRDIGGHTTAHVSASNDLKVFFYYCFIIILLFCDCCLFSLFFSTFELFFVCY